MNVKLSPFSPQKCEDLIVGCYEKVKEIHSPEFKHLSLISTTLFLTFPSNYNRKY